jgi:competence protein ComEA
MVIINFSKKAAKEFFSYSKTEIRGIVVLSVLIIILISIRVYMASQNNVINLKVVRTNKPAQGQDIIQTTNEVFASEKSELTIACSPFDPNTASYNQLLSFGINEKVARNIIKYREKGGKFHQPVDLLKIYGIDSSIFLELRPYIIITRNISSEMKSISDKKNGYSINLNTADSSQLKSIPGIGTVLSKRIIKYRTLLGGFYTPSQLTEVYGISDSLFNTFSENVFADTNYIISINVNTCKQEELEKHPYLTKYQAKAIQGYIKLSGTLINKKQLLDNYILSEETYLKIAPYLTLN